MKFPVISFLAFFVFFATTVVSFVHGEMISRETLLSAYRNKFHIEQKTSTDGVITLSPIAASMYTSRVLPVVMNHTRTLRAFLVERGSGAGQPVIVIEQANPRAAFMLTGKFSVAHDAVALYWPAQTTLSFFGETEDHQPVEYTVNVETLSYAVQPRSISTPPFRDKEIVD